MKRIKFSKLMLAFTFVVLAVGMLTYTSCTKEKNVGQANRKSLTDGQKQQILDAFNAIPEIQVKAGKYGFTLPKTLKDGGFNFSESSDGTDWSTSSNVEFVENSDGSIMIVSTDNASANAGGMVVAGSTSLEINMAICVSSAADGNNFFSFGDIDSSFGFSMVLGIAGDFEALLSGDVDPDADITEYIYGFAMYIVYEDQANGSYEVLDFTAPELEDFESKGISMVIDFRGAKVYISSNGTLTVGSNTITFSGNYYSGIWESDSTSNNEDEPSYQEVSGFGTMGCM